MSALSSASLLALLSLTATPEPDAAVPAPATAQTPVRATSAFAGESPAQFAAAASKPECVAACKAGGETFLNFCRSLPEPRLRAGCWALQFASVTACIGWCYANF